MYEVMYLFSYVHIFSSPQCSSYYIIERHGSKAKMVLSLLIPLILLLVCPFQYQKAFAKKKTPDFFRLFMLSAKLDPKIYSVDLHFVLYFIEFWKNMLYFFTFYNKNDCKPLKMININDQYDNLVVYLDKKSHV